MRRSPVLWLFLLPGTLLYLVLFIYPTLSGMFYSFTDWDGVSPSYRMVGAANYKETLESIVFRKAFINNVKFMLVVVLFQTLLSLGLAMLLARNSRIHVLLRALYFFPTVLSSVSVGLIWSFVYDPSIGLLNLSLQKAGLESLALSWTGDAGLALYSIAAVQVWAHAGQMMIVFIAGLHSIPAELYEAARIDGGGRWQIFRKVTWPLLAPSATIVLAYTTIQSFKAFDLIFTMTDGGPNYATEILTTYIYHQAFGSYKFGSAAAGSMLFLILLSVLTALQFRALRADRVSY
ncbi:carbohydrate ABC transporter permease [Paenibacillus mucilaginosus]|uniref:Sugar ABC transporter permease n=1 Tax=Paenibacillus mucilaginosus 3016 TaxID=1116391 RepID=H6NP55_9BACL|nr:sugar ABC transporter permease [Paenibacillus mucilaginosus]AFC31129.1 sugar ABC transporter permease [Paenibacillus mucilaginosus 3016]MCG7211970.1 sugar ABC transporter permease [Paenibacillus mucilaginosus]WDM25040.1 sugar ABC transporter permease [Paenibacillus mucilaginosus]